MAERGIIMKLAKWFTKPVSNSTAITLTILFIAVIAILIKLS